jgi:hypothetical protein
LPNSGVGCLAAPAQRRLVHHVVVQQGGGVDELHGGCQRQLRRAGVAQCVGKQQYKSGADPLATGADDVLADLIDERHIGCEPFGNHAVDVKPATGSARS